MSHRYQAAFILWTGGWCVTSEAYSSISSASPTQKVSMGLVVKFKAKQQPTILATFSKSESIVLWRKAGHRASLIFYYSNQYCFYYYYIIIIIIIIIIILLFSLLTAS